MTRTAVLHEIAAQVGAPLDHSGPAMSALRSVLDNPSNDGVNAALTELAEEMTFLNRIYRALQSKQGVVFEEEAPAGQ